MRGVGTIDRSKKGEKMGAIQHLRSR